MSELPPGRVRTAPLTPAERRHLWWAAPPLAVLVLAHLFFDVTGGRYGEVARTLVADVPGDGADGRAAVVAAAVLGWAGLALVYLVVAAGAAGGAVRLLTSRVRGRARRPFLVFALAVTAAGLAHLGLVDRFDRPLADIFGVTVDALAAEPTVGGVQVAAMAAAVTVINVASVAVPALFLAAAAATTLPPGASWSEASLAGAARAIRQVVAIAAGFMVAGVLHMGAWTQLAGATLSAEGDHRHDLVAVAVTLFWGGAPSR